MPPMRPRWKTGQTTTCLILRWATALFTVMVPRWSRYGIRCFARFWFSYSVYCPQPAGYFAERSGRQATTGCPPGYSAECEESLSGPYSVESGKDIDGYPYEKCRWITGTLWKTSGLPVMRIYWKSTKSRWSVWTCRPESCPKQRSSPHCLAVSACHER